MSSHFIRDAVILTGFSVAAVLAFQNRTAIYEAVGFTPGQASEPNVITLPAPQPQAVPKAQPRRGAAVSIPKSANGQFQTEARVNSAHVPFLIDTGASFVALTLEDAMRAGIRQSDLDYTVSLQTANGETKGAWVTLQDVSIGAVALQDVRAVVIKDGLSISLLGMSFLGELQSVQVNGSDMLLRL